MNRLGPALIATSLALVAGTALLGPSVATRGGAFHLHPSPWLVVALLAVATLAGAAGLLFALRALDHGWAPDPRRLLVAGTVAAFALVLVPPITSEDVYSYAAYGRLAVLHHDPYTTRPSSVADPVTQGAGTTWRDAPSVYGPLATAEQYAVMKAAGRHHRTLFQLVCALAFAGTGALLYRTATDRRRAALLWSGNPLLLLHLVAAAHVDALLVLLAVAALVALRRNAFLAGLLAGGAVCVKVSGVLVTAALARRRPVVAVAAALVAIPAYLAVGGATALKPVRNASRLVTTTSPWHAVTKLGLPRGLVTTLALAAALALIPLFVHGLPGDDSPQRTTAAVTLAWLVAAAYVTPWYDAWLWPFLALLPASRWDRWLTARTALLTLAILPGRAPLPPGLAGIVTGFRTYATPIVLVFLAVVAIRACYRELPWRSTSL